jgi:hypothetical protein
MDVLPDTVVLGDERFGVSEQLAKRLCLGGRLPGPGFDRHVAYCGRHWWLFRRSRFSGWLLRPAPAKRVKIKIRT